MHSQDIPLQKAFFFHIPKCAGMSVWNALWDIYGQSNVFQVGIKAQREEFEEMSAERRSSYGAIGGHGFLSRLRSAAGDLDGYFKFVTFRDPVDRIVSEYHFIRKSREHFKYDVVSKIPLIEFAQQRDVINMQTRLMCDHADPDRALAVLDDFFDHWSLMDDLDSFVSRLYMKLGKAPKLAVHVNKARKRRPAEDPEVIEAIRALNAADITFLDRLKERKTERQTLLCVGGSQDGRRFSVPFGQLEFSIAENQTANASYRVHQVNTNVGAYAFLAPNGWTEKQAMAHLFSND